MTHLHEGRLRALLDGELGEGEADAARAHLDRCGACSGLLAEIEAASVVIGAALHRLDTVAVPAGAREAVMARVGAAGGGAASVTDIRSAEPAAPRRQSAPAPPRFALARAAILVLCFGGAVATALPASPVRGWIGSGWDRAVEFFAGAGSDQAPVEPEIAEAPAQTPEAAGVRLEVAAGELVVLLEDVEPGTELDVRLVDGFQAAVFAAQPASFRTAEGRIEVSGGSGRVRVDLPRSVQVASVAVNGRIYITKAGGRLDATGAIVRQSAEEVRLRVR